LSRVVDPFIVSSFDRTGFRIHSLTFRADDLDVDLSGRRCLVTGANSGIGYEAALALADLGAEVALLCRSRERVEEAAQQIREHTGNTRVFPELVDLSDLGSIRSAAARLSSGPVDVLVHNAGVLPDERVETDDGLDADLRDTRGRALPAHALAAKQPREVIRRPGDLGLVGRDVYPTAEPRGH
jgi:NAD(P)-dependent dehydrogenase (short-subunit alcohol dehydrogenase family)